jgi:phospholipid-binding lipoprotein MlaA
MKTIRSLILFLVLFPATLSAQIPTDEPFPDLLTEEWEDAYKEDDGEKDLAIRDPLEPMNRFFFKVNDELYEWVLKPTTKVYSRIFPLELRECFGNFFQNLASPITFVNALLQGDFPLAGNVLGRFVINSTIGVYGFADVASQEFDIQPERADFGQTLGKWGLGEGIFLFWPVFGPSSIRDSVGLVADTYLHPVPYLHDDWTLDAAYYATGKVNNLSLHPDVYEDMKRYALDPYVATRQAYYEYRKAKIEE